jgi:hypothetical protein
MNNFFWFIRSRGYFVYSKQCKCIEYIKMYIESIKKCIELYKIKKFFHHFPAWWKKILIDCIAATSKSIINSVFIRTHTHGEVLLCQGLLWSFSSNWRAGKCAWITYNCPKYLAQLWKVSSPCQRLVSDNILSRKWLFGSSYYYHKS